MNTQKQDQQRFDINNLCQEVHEANKKWWTCLHCKNGFIRTYGQRIHGDTTPIEVSVLCSNCNEGKLFRNVGEMLCLVHSEISEALEGHRKNLMDDKLPHRKMLEVELADAVIRIFDIAAGLNLDLGGAYVEKMAYNAVREDHKIENRVKEGGKKY